MGIVVPIVGHGIYGYKWAKHLHKRVNFCKYVFSGITENMTLRENQSMTLVGSTKRGRAISNHCNSPPSWSHEKNLVSRCKPENKFFCCSTFFDICHCFWINGYYMKLNMFFPQICISATTGLLSTNLWDTNVQSKIEIILLKKLFSIIWPIYWD